MPEVPVRNDVAACTGTQDVGIELSVAPVPAVGPAVVRLPSLRLAPPVRDDEVASRLAAAGAVLAEVRSALANDASALRALVVALDDVDGRAARLLVRRGEGSTLDVDASVSRVLAVDVPMRRAALGELVAAVCERSLEVAGDALAAADLDALLARIAGWTRLAGA